MTRLLFVLAACVAMTACGKQGDLERPGPLWGPEAKAAREAEARKAEEDRARAAAGTPAPAPAQ